MPEQSLSETATYLLKATADRKCSHCTRRNSRGSYIFIRMEQDRETVYCHFCYKDQFDFQKNPLLCTVEELSVHHIQLADPPSDNEKKLLQALTEKKGDGEIKPLLEAQPSLVCFQDMESKTPLHYAAERSDIELIRLLLFYNPPLEARDDFERTPLALACLGWKEEKIKAMQLLIEAGADINARDQVNKTPLHQAAEAFVWLDPQHNESITPGQIATAVDAVELLLQNEADVNARDIGNCTAAFEIIRKKIKEPQKIYETLQILINHGLDVNVRDSNGDTLLHELVRVDPNNARDMIRLLLDNGADTRMKDSSGHTPLFKALSELQLDLAMIMLGRKLKAW